MNIKGVAAKEHVFKGIEGPLDCRLNIDIDYDWLLPPKDKIEEIKREQLKYKIKNKIAIFLNDKEVCAGLMNLILSS